MSKKIVLTIFIAGAVLLMGSVLFRGFIQETQTYNHDKVADKVKAVKAVEDTGKTKSGKEKPAETASPERGNDFNILEALDSGDYKLQEQAIQKIRSEKLEYAADKLLQMIKAIPKGKIDIAAINEDEMRINSLAALALSEMKNKKALPIIIDVIGEAPFPAAYDENMLALSALNYGKDALPLIEDKIEEYGRRNPYGKMSLLSILMNMKDKDAIPKLQDLMDSRDPDIKTAAARGLRNLGEPVEIAEIVKTLKDIEANPRSGKQWLETRDRLVDELGFSGNPEAIPLLKERIERGLEKSRQYPPIYGEIVALARIGGQDNYLYLRNIYDKAEFYSVKSYIIMAFGEGKMTEAVKFLKDILNNKEYNDQLRIKSAWSLQKITGQDYLSIRNEIREGKR
jgi:HEAT repeat protein